MKKYILLILMFTFSGCMATRNTASLYTSQAIDNAARCSAVKPYKEVKVSWYQKPFITEVQQNLEDKESRYAPCTQKEYDKLLALAANIYSKYGLVDENNGEDALQVHLLSDDWWRMSQLWGGFFIDTAFLFLWPASIVTTHKINVTSSRPANSFVYNNEGTVKATFHLFLFLAYPFAIPSSKQYAAMEDLIKSSLPPLLMHEQKPECLLTEGG